MPPVDHAACVAAAYKALEEAWDCNTEGGHVLHLVADLLAARRAAADAGMVSVMVSKESIEGLKAAVAKIERKNDGPGMHLDMIATVKTACVDLARDLAAVLNPEGGVR